MVDGLRKEALACTSDGQIWRFCGICLNQGSATDPATAIASEPATAIATDPATEAETKRLSIISAAW